VLRQARRGGGGEKPIEGIGRELRQATKRRRRKPARKNRPRASLREGRPPRRRAQARAIDPAGRRAAVEAHRRVAFAPQRSEGRDRRARESNKKRRPQILARG